MSAGRRSSSIDSRPIGRATGPVHHRRHVGREPRQRVGTSSGARDGDPGIYPRLAEPLPT